MFNPFRYNLFSSFKRRLKNTNHIIEQEPQIKKYYHKQLSFYAIRYCKFCIILSLVIAFSIKLYEGSSKILTERKITSYTITQDANVRVKPTVDSEIYKVLKSGTKVTGNDIGKWIEIKDKEKNYYVSKSLVTPTSSGAVLLIRILNFIFSIIPVWIPRIFGFIKRLYTDYAVVQAIIIVIYFIIIFKFYAMFARDKNNAMEAVFEQICDNCGYFGAIEKTRQKIDSKVTQESRVSYETQTAVQRNTRGDVISTTTSDVPISTIVNVHEDTYKINFYCKKCNCNSYILSTDIWES